MLVGRDLYFLVGSGSVGMGYMGVRYNKGNFGVDGKVGYSFVDMGDVVGSGKISVGVSVRYMFLGEGIFKLGSLMGGYGSYYGGMIFKNRGLYFGLSGDIGFVSLDLGLGVGFYGSVVYGLYWGVSLVF